MCTRLISLSDGIYNRPRWLKLKGKTYLISDSFYDLVLILKGFFDTNKGRGATFRLITPAISYFVLRLCLAEEKFWSLEDFLIPTVPLLIIGH